MKRSRKPRFGLEAVRYYGTNSIAEESLFDDCGTIMSSAQVADAPMSIIGGTRSSVHLIGRDLISGRQRPLIRRGEVNRRFHTANGTIEADSLISLQSQKSTRHI